MKKILTIILLTLIIPQIAFAAWWNPLSWMGHSESVVEQESEISEVGAEVPQEKVDLIENSTTEAKERVVTITDPKLQNQINELIKENANLKSLITSQSMLEQQLNQCKVDIANIKNKINLTVDSEYQDKKEKLIKLDDELYSLIEKMVDGVDEYLSVGDIESIKDRTNEIFIAYKYIDPKFNIKDIPNHLSFMSEGGQLSKKIVVARTSFKEDYLKLKKDLDWYVKYR